MIWTFLLGLALGLIVLCIYAVIVSGSKYDLGLENARLKRELRMVDEALKAWRKREVNELIEQVKDIASKEGKVVVIKDGVVRIEE